MKISGVASVKNKEMIDLSTNMFDSPISSIVDAAQSTLSVVNTLESNVPDFGNTI